MIRHLYPLRQSSLRLRVLPLLFAGLLATGCDDNPVDDDFEPVETVLVENLPADPHTGTDPQGRPIGTGQFAFYSLRDDRTIPHADSATVDWDVAFNGTTILTNGGSSGPGNGGAIVVAEPFEAVLEAPVDDEILQDEPGAPAIARSPAGDWYNYSGPPAHLVTPVPGRTIVVRTADGRFAKIRILSYYQDAPDEIDATSASRYYTFEYVFQPDGSRSLVVD